MTAAARYWLGVVGSAAAVLAVLLVVTPLLVLAVSRG